MRVEILSVDLVGANFVRVDDDPLPTARADAIPQMGYRPEWKLSEDGSVLGCAVTFGTVFDEEAPYEITARFRLLYAVSRGDALSPRDITQFAAWNAIFNAWPYWREYVSSTINRGHLPAFVVPVMRVPRGSAAPPLERPPLGAPNRR